MASGLTHIPEENTDVYAVEIMVPSGSAGEFSALNVNGATKESIDKLTDAIVQNWRPVATASNGI